VADFALGIVGFAVVVFAFEIEGELKAGVKNFSRFGEWLNIICCDILHERM